MNGVSCFDQVLMRDSYSSPAMRDVFCEQARVQAWLDVEAALAIAQAKLGIIPKDAADEIARVAKFQNLDMNFIMEQTRLTKHPLVPSVRGLERACANGAGEWVHYGVTTQDIIDTGFVLQLRRGLELVRQDLKQIATSLRELAFSHRATPMMGRTLALQALPISFGHKVAIWLSELVRHFDRIKELEKRLYVVQLVGAVGTKAGLGELSEDLEIEVAKQLGLGVPNISWQPARDNFVELGFVIGNISASINKIAHQILLLSHNEIAELNEPFGVGQVGSSTMPHKRNPALSENAVTLTNAIKANLAVISDIARHEHERDGQVWKMEYKLLSEMFLMLSAALANMKIVFADLQVNVEKMRINLDILGGYVLAERVMFALAPTLGKQHSHEIVYEICMNGINSGISFKDALLLDKRVKLNESEIDRLLDASTYMGKAPELVDKFLKSIENAEIFK